MIHAPTINARTWFCIKKKSQRNQLRFLLNHAKNVLLQN